MQCSQLRASYQEINERRFFFLKRFPLLRLLLDKFKLLEKPSTTVAKHDIVILTNNKTKDEMHTILQHTFEERGILPHGTKLGQNVICRVGDPRKISNLLR